MRGASWRAATVLEYALREGDDEHLARRVAENVIDRGREETRLATPARRRPEHDQIGAHAIGLGFSFSLNPFFSRINPTAPVRANARISLSR